MPLYLTRRFKAGGAVKGPDGRFRLRTRVLAGQYSIHGHSPLKKMDALPKNGGDGAACKSSGAGSPLYFGPVYDLNGGGLNGALITASRVSKTPPPLFNYSQIYLKFYEP